MNIPAELRYGTNHEWVSLEGDIATVGITEYAQRELSDIVFVECNKEGEHLVAEQTFATIEAVKTVSDIFMPMAGVIEQFNKEVLRKPELINQDPYGQGWIIRIKVDNPTDFFSLMSSEVYKQTNGL